MWSLQADSSPAVDPHATPPPPKPSRLREHLPKEFVRHADFTSWMIPPATHHETWFRHSSWKVKRVKVRTALTSCGTNEFALNRFDECGSECSVEWSKTENRYRLRANTCKCRHCEPCMRAKANKLAGNLKNRLGQKPNGRYRFVTLTLAHTDEPLADQIKHLYQSFKKLRRQPAWKRTQRGGAAMLEVKWQPDSRQWHPHLHIVAEGGYLSKFDLAGEWKHASGGSFVVDIRSLSNEKDVAHYVAKYVTKGINNHVWDDRDAAQEWISAAKGVRCCFTFGTWRGFKLTANPPDPGDWKPVGRLHEICERAQRGNLSCLQILIALRPPGWSEERKVKGKARESS